jgi:hypothetical protein
MNSNMFLVCPEIVRPRFVTPYWRQIADSIMSGFSARIGNRENQR